MDVLDPYRMSSYGRDKYENRRDHRWQRPTVNRPDFNVNESRITSGYSGRRTIELPRNCRQNIARVYITRSIKYTRAFCRVDRIKPVPFSVRESGDGSETGDVERKSDETNDPFKCISVCCTVSSSSSLSSSGRLKN